MSCTEMSCPQHGEANRAGATFPRMSETPAGEHSADYDRGCRYGPSGLPSCLAGTRDERWWCKACADHALIRWLVETVHYPFDFSFSTPPPIDHRALADHWNAWDGWGLTAEEAYASVAEEAGLTHVIASAETAEGSSE